METKEREGGGGGRGIKIGSPTSRKTDNHTKLHTDYWLETKKVGN